VVGLSITSGLDLMCGVNNVYWYVTNMYRMGPPVDSVNRWFIFVAEKTMVYGRYNELVNGDYN
jgi:hypothetical protein